MRHPQKDALEAESGPYRTFTFLKAAWQLTVKRSLKYSYSTLLCRRQVHICGHLAFRSPQIIKSTWQMSAHSEGILKDRQIRHGALTSTLLLWFMKSTTGHMAYHLTFWDNARSYSRLNSAAAMAPFSTCINTASVICMPSLRSPLTTFYQ